MTNFVKPAALMLAAAALSTPAMANDLAVPAGLYATFFAGASLASDYMTTADLEPYVEQEVEFTFEPSLSFGGALGASVSENVRAELEFAYRSSPVARIGGVDVIDSGSSSEASLLGNVWLDLETGGNFTPYLGGGLGISHHRANGAVPGDALDYAATGVTYQAGAGVRMDVAERVALDLGYRFRGFHADSALFDGEPPPDGYDGWVDGANHVVQAGLTFGF